jgi:hypothetical protein
MNITQEADYIIERAQMYEARIVSLGPLLFFSTETGDAWLLDPADHLALCLAHEGERQPFEISETAHQFAINWQANYQIEDNQFIILERSGRVRSIIGYPVRELEQSTRRAIRRK